MQSGNYKIVCFDFDFCFAVGQMTPVGGRKKLLNLPPFAQPAANLMEPETENKLQNIKKRNGILNIDDVPYETDIKDLEHLGELGNGTSGHVVKMRHKQTGRIIAVKVNIEYAQFISSNRWIIFYSKCVALVIWKKQNES